MKISVLVPSIRPDVLPFAIRSILRQSWREWELIVIAQGAYPELEATIADVAQGDPRVRALRMEGMGVSRARNMGLSQIEGEIVAMMDDDCEAREDWLSTLAEIFTRHPDIGMVSGWLIPPKVKYGRLWFCPTVEIPEVLYDPMVPPHHPPPEWKFVTANLAVRSDIALCAGPFDPYLGAGAYFCAAEDPDWGMRLERMGVKMLSTPRSVVYHTYGVRYGLDAVLRIKRGYGRGNGALAAKLTLMGSPAGKKWLMQNRRECLLEPLLNPRLVHRLYGLYYFERAYRECLADFYVDENSLLQPRIPNSIPAPGLLSSNLSNSNLSNSNLLNSNLLNSNLSNSELLATTSMSTTDSIFPMATPPYDVADTDREASVISIIVPAYNAARFLRTTLNTVLAQTCSDWELLVIDDGSTDDTAAVARSIAAADARIRTFTIPNGGACRARNFGFAQANVRSEYILFLDHDDVLEPFALDVLLAALSAHPDAAGAVGAVQEKIVSDLSAEDKISSTSHSSTSHSSTSNTSIASISNPVTRNGLAGPLGALTFAEMVTFCRIWTMGQVLIRREWLERVGPLDPECGASDDWDLYLRLTMHRPFVTTPIRTIHWTHHSSNTSNDKLRMAQAEEAVRAKLLASPDLSAEQRQQVLALFQRSRHELAARQWEWALEAWNQRRFGEAFLQTRRALGNFLRAHLSRQAR